MMARAGRLPINFFSCQDCRMATGLIKYLLGSWNLLHVPILTMAPAVASILIFCLQTTLSNWRELWDNGRHGWNGDSELRRSYWFNPCDTWKIADEAKGLKARGNLIVDMKWIDGRVAGYTISSPVTWKVKMTVNGAIKEVITKKLW